jgi:signal peptidase I
MTKDNEGKSELTAQKTQNRVAEAANTLEWLITAFALAFVFRAFVMEAFRIPTGSMADTLLGAHHRLRCTQCGYKYCYGHSGARASRSPAQTRKEYSRCPSCGYYQPTGGMDSVSSGDRILVLKCIYQFSEPKQWDVVVFKNPLNPTENYIKRMVARPGETVEIIDGDVYINGQISRKPPKVQEELWMPVYENDYQPARPEEPSFNRHTWRQPFRNSEGSKWTIGEEAPTIFKLTSSPGEEHWLFYDTSLGNDFRATYAYDETDDYGFMPHCSDLKVRFWVSCDKAEGAVGALLSKYGISYTGRIDFTGQMTIHRLTETDEQVLATRNIGTLAVDTLIEGAQGRMTMFSFANVDHELVLEFGSERVVCDLGQGPDDAGTRRTDVEPKAAIFGAGNMSISHLALFRDIYYTGVNPSSNEVCRAGEGNPLKLEANQFFVLGDNSPCSQDSRWWRSPGKGNNGKIYPEGIVPREYLVGKALFVYWPAGFKPFPKFPLALVPNVGEIRFIYGGSNNTDKGG